MSIVKVHLFLLWILFGFTVATAPGIKTQCINLTLEMCQYPLFETLLARTQAWFSSVIYLQLGCFNVSYTVFAVNKNVRQARHLFIGFSVNTKRQQMNILMSKIIRSFARQELIVILLGQYIVLLYILSCYVFCN